MTPIDSATVETSLAETIREKLQTSSVPLNLNDVTKGIRRPKKVTAADFKAEIRKILEEEVRLGRVFSILQVNRTKSVLGSGRKRFLAAGRWKLLLFPPLSP